MASSSLATSVRSCLLYDCSSLATIIVHNKQRLTRPFLPALLGCHGLLSISLRFQPPHTRNAPLTYPFFLSLLSPTSLSPFLLNTTPTPTPLFLVAAEDMTPDELAELTESYGTLHRVFLMCDAKTGRGLGYGFVEYATQEQALAARGHLASRVVGERPIRVDTMQPLDHDVSGYRSRTLFIDKLPRTFVDLTALEQLLQQEGRVEFCKLVMSGGQSRGFAFVDLQTYHDAVCSSILGCLFI